MTVQEIKTRLALLEEELRVLLNPHTMTANETKIYNEARLNLGRHLTLNEAVPEEEGCMEAVSKILSLAGYLVPSGGIAGTATGNEWFVSQPHIFERIDHPEQGSIINFVTGTGNGSVEGHILIVGEFNLQWANDWGLMSNDSASGKFLETWSWNRACAYWTTVGGIIPSIWRAL